MLLAVRLCHEWFGPDIWYHLALGERVARTGAMQPADNLILQQPGFVNVYWLFQLLVRGAFELGGVFAVSALFVAVWFAAFAFWFRTTGAGRASPWGQLLALAAVLVCQVRFEERPEIFSYLFLAIQIHWLVHWKLDAPAEPRALARFALVQLLWSNIHGYFVLGPLLVAAKIIGVAIATPRGGWPRGRAGWSGLWLLAAFTIGATFASPFGADNWRGVAVLWKFFGEMRHEVQEFLPATGAYFALWTVKLFWLAWVLTLIAAGYTLFTAARREAFALLLAAAGLWLSATSFRNIPLLVFLSAPLAAVGLRRREGFRPFEKFAAVATGGVALGLAAAAVAGTFGPSSFGIRASPAASPLAFADYLRTSGFRGKLFNHPGDGGYLEFRFPTLRLYGDSRYVDAAPVRDYFAALRTVGAFQHLNERHRFDAALFRMSDSRAVIRDLLGTTRWRLVYADLHRALLIDTLSPSAAAFGREQFNYYLGEDLAVRTNGDDAVEWAGLFAEANRPDDLQRVLDAFGTAPRVPAALVEVALRYGLATRQEPILATAHSLRPKMIVAKPADAEVIDRLLAQASR